MANKKITCLKQGIYIFLCHWPENTEKHWLSAPETGLTESSKKLDGKLLAVNLLSLFCTPNTIILNEIPQIKGHEIKQFALKYNVRR